MIKGLWYRCKLWTKAHPKATFGLATLLLVFIWYIGTSALERQVQYNNRYRYNDVAMLDSVGIRASTGFGGIPKRTSGMLARGVASVADAAHDSFEKFLLHSSNESSNTVASDSPSDSYEENPEHFEVSSYGVQYESTEIQDLCDEIGTLRDVDGIIFTYSHKRKTHCDFSLMVPKNDVVEVIRALKLLDPKEFSEEVHTIASSIKEYKTQGDILREKLAIIEATLDQTNQAYAELTEVAKRSGSPDALARSIESRINTIERLMREQATISGRLRAIEKQQAEELEKVQYAYFNIHVTKKAIIDSEQLGDSWKDVFRKAIYDGTDILQTLSVGIVILALRLVQFTVYGFIFLVIGKMLYRYVRTYWQK